MYLCIHSLFFNVIFSSSFPLFRYIHLTSLQQNLPNSNMPYGVYQACVLPGAFGDAELGTNLFCRTMSLHIIFLFLYLCMLQQAMHLPIFFLFPFNHTFFSFFFFSYVSLSSLTQFRVFPNFFFPTTLSLSPPSSSSNFLSLLPSFLQWSLLLSLSPHLPTSLLISFSYSFYSPSIPSLPFPSVYPDPLSQSTSKSSTGLGLLITVAVALILSFLCLFVVVAILLYR